MIADDYEIVSVESSDPPRGLAGAGWYRYVIGQGENTIHGYRQGDLESVTESVKAIVERLNERRFGRRGRVQLDMSAREKDSPARQKSVPAVHRQRFR